MFKKSNVTPSIAAMLLAVLMLIAAPSALAAESNGYTDVDPDNSHYEAIMKLTEEGHLSGHGDGTFDPFGDMTRRHVALVLFSVLGLEKPENLGKVLSKYDDVSIDSLYAEQIAAVTEAGYFSGSNGKFMPLDPLSRQQSATVFDRIFGLSMLYAQEHQDINLRNVGVSHADAVQTLANLNLTNQFDDFKPGDDVSRGAFATFLHRTQLKLDEIGVAFDLSFMHMNDTHARVDKLPKMVTAVHEVRAEKPDALLLNGGDVFSGTLYFNEFKGQADVALLNLMGLDAMVYGNHEFDLGGKEGGQESLSKFVKAANFPLLGTNTDFSEDPFMAELVAEGEVVEDPKSGQSYHSIVKEVNGEKIGIFGLTTEDTMNIANPVDVTFADFEQTAKDAVAKFEAEGVNKVVAVTHMGYDSDPSVGNDKRLAEVDGVDVIIGGHSHTALDTPQVVTTEGQSPTVIAQAGEYANYLGTLDVKFNAEGEVVGHAGELLDLADYPADRTALQVLKPYKKQVEEKNNEESGAVALKELPNPRQDEVGDDSVRANETALGNLITDAMLTKAQEKFPDTVIAFQNGGGIRAPIDKGPITIGEIITVLPFGNDPVTAELKGEEIKTILEHSVRNAPAENGGFLHVSGMKFEYDSDQDPGDRVTDMQVKTEDGYEEIQLDETYRITTNGFTGQGGDGFDTFAQAYEDGRVRDIGEIDWDQLRQYMVDDLNGEVNPEVEGRIVDVARD